MYFLIPTIAHAEATASVKLLIYRISDYVLNPLIKVLFVAALVYFLWGVVQYIRDRNAGRIWESSVFDDKGKVTSKGADHIVYGLIGLFIMVSVFGIMNIILSLLGINLRLP